MSALTAVGWVEPEEPSNPAKGVTSWRVNPAVHTRYAKHGEAERSRRERERESIAAAAAMMRAARRTETCAAE